MWGLQHAIKLANLVSCLPFQIWLWQPSFWLVLHCVLLLSFGLCGTFQLFHLTLYDILLLASYSVTVVCHCVCVFLHRVHICALLVVCVDYILALCFAQTIYICHISIRNAHCFLLFGPSCTFQLILVFVSCVLPSSSLFYPSLLCVCYRTGHCLYCHYTIYLGLPFSLWTALYTPMGTNECFL